MMNLKSLVNQYTEADLGDFPGDGALRFRTFAPFLKDLGGRKIVYHEKFVCIAAIDDVEISTEHFSASATVLIHIEQEGRPLFPPRRPWTFGGSWEHMILSARHFHAPYVGWSIWPEADLVSEVEAHAKAGRFSQALKLSVFEEFDEPDF